MPSDDKYIYVSATLFGHTITVARRNLEHDDGVDPCLFEPDYTIAGSTGFLLWPGTWVLLRLFQAGEHADPCNATTATATSTPATLPSLRLADRLRSRRVIELGSGTGLAGLCAAAAGTHVLLTDLPSVVGGILADNVARNATATTGGEPGGVSERAPSPPTPHISGVGTSSGPAASVQPPTGPWDGAVLVGPRGGSAACMALDWSVPLAPQLSKQAAVSADALIAVDVVWLAELLVPFRDTVLGLLHLCRPGTPCLLVFLDRAKGGSSRNFSSREAVRDAFASQGCTVAVVHAEEVEVDGERLLAEVLEITLGGGALSDALGGQTQALE